MGASKRKHLEEMETEYEYSVSPYEYDSWEKFKEELNENISKAKKCKACGKDINSNRSKKDYPINDLCKECQDNLFI